MTEQWQELKDTIIEMRDNDGTGTQQDACKFLVNLMDVLEKQTSESILDKIRAEIKDWQTDIHDNEYDAEKHDFVFERIFEIIDKYRK